MKFQRMKDMVFGSAVTLTLLVMTFSVTAKVTQENISVAYRDIKIVVDGTQLQTDKEPFIYEGTTYLPVRAVGEAVDKTVGWDETTNVVTLTTAGGATEPEETETEVTAEPETTEPETTVDEAAKLAEIQKWHTEDILKNGFAQVLYYVESGKDASGADIDIDAALTSIAVEVATLEEYNTFITALDSAKYADVQTAWSALYTEAKALADKVATDTPSANSTSYKFDTKTYITLAKAFDKAVANVK